MSLSFGVFLPPFDELAEPRRLVELARSAEEAGWDGFFLWDHMLAFRGMAVADSWILAAAIAEVTERMRLGLLVTPLARRRPWVVAREAATLDRLSGGRLVIGVGLGDDGWGEFSSFSGEAVEPDGRRVLLDDSLDLLRRFWSGEPVDYMGEQLEVHSGEFRPRPLQDPLPVWVACRWPNRRPLDRAARQQGCFPLLEEREGEVPLLPEPEKVAELRQELLKRGASPAIDIVCRGVSGLADRDELPGRFEALEAAGMTWWLESFGAGEPPAQVVEEVVAAGPPR